MAVKKMKTGPKVNHPLDAKKSVTCSISLRTDKAAIKLFGSRGAAIEYAVEHKYSTPIKIS